MIIIGVMCSVIIIGFILSFINEAVTDFNKVWYKGLLTDDDIKSFILKACDKHIYDLIYNKKGEGNKTTNQFKLSFKSDITKNKLFIMIESN